MRNLWLRGNWRTRTRRKRHNIGVDIITSDGVVVLQHVGKGKAQYLCNLHNKELCRMMQLQKQILEAKA